MRKSSAINPGAKSQVSRNIATLHSSGAPEARQKGYMLGVRIYRYPPERRTG